MRYSDEDFIHIKVNQTKININDLIKEDEDFKKFISVGNQNSRIVFYKNTPVAYEYESNYLGNPEYQCGVFKDFRGMGIGSYLLNRFREKKFKENYKTVVVLIDKNNKNSVNNAIKNGFRLDDTFEEINSDNKEEQYYIYYSNNPNYISKKGR